MIKEHIQSISKVSDSIDDLHALAKTLPESKEKYKILAYCEMFEETLNNYADNSAELYDNLVKFGFAVAALHHREYC